MRWLSKFQPAAIGVYLYRRVRRHLFAYARARVLLGWIHQDTTPNNDQPLIEQRDVPTLGNRMRPRKSCGGLLMDTETNRLTNARFAIEPRQTRLITSRRTVPAQLGYSTLAFALDGFTVFAPSLQSTFQLSLAVLVSYRFCGHI